MIIKKYVFKNMNEALRVIKTKLGPSALIVSQRKVRAKGIKGYFTPKLLEVTVALESNKPKETFEMNRNSINDIQKVMRESLKEKNEIKKESPNNFKEYKIEAEKEKEKDKLNDEINEMKNLLNKVVKNTKKEKDNIENKLEDLDIDREFREEILTKLDSLKEEEKEDGLREIIRNEIVVSNEELKGKVVLIGPTGVGKTTTIAKLAGKLVLKENKKVGLITTDTYRIGAVEQLKTYAEIMNIPFKVAITSSDMEKAIEEMKDLDVVLIDSTGRSSKNIMQISELRALIDKAKPDSVNLVISATTKNKDVNTIVNGYSSLGYDRIIITKLDETMIYGSIYNILKRSKKPISFLTIGQNVPDDIRTFNKSEIEKIIFGEVTL